MENQQNEERYYIPKASDLYIGYECEVNLDKVFKNVVLTTANSIKRAADYLAKINPPFAEVRTKCLDREDIESLGWKWLGQTTYVKTIVEIVEESAVPHQYTLSQYSKNVQIMKKHHVRFNGFVSSINELRKVMEYLGIDTP